MAGTGFTEAEQRSPPPEEDATTKPKLNADAAPHGAIATDDDGPDADHADHADHADRSGGGTARAGADVDVDDLQSLESLEDIDELEDMDEGEDDLDDEDSLSALGDDDTVDDDALETGADDLGVAAVEADGTARKAAAPADASPEAETDDDELLTDEVEASLDVILAERLRGGETEADDEVELEDEEDDTPNQLATVIPVRRPEEFLCQSCFLLKPPGQLADRDHQLCRDCA